MKNSKMIRIRFSGSFVLRRILKLVTIAGGAAFLGGPTPSYAVKENLLQSLTSAGAGGVYIQSLEISNHIYKTVDEERSFFLKKYWDQEPQFHPNVEIALPISWNLGVAYTHSTSAPPKGGAQIPINDQFFSTAFGINWEITQRFELGLRMGIDYSPEESYTHGIGLFRAEYTIYFKPLSRPKRSLASIDADPNYDPSDARQYYLHEYLKKDEELSRYHKLTKSRASRGLASSSSSNGDDIYEEDDDKKPEDDRELYPNLKVAYNLGFDRHSILPKSYRSLLGNVTTETDLYQFQNGVELIYNPSIKWAFRVAFNIYRYTGSSVDSFLPLLESSTINHFPTSYFGNGSSLSFTNQYLQFPDHSFDEAIDWFMSNRDSLSLNFNQTVYMASNLNYTFAFNPAYYHDFGKKWRIGFIGNAIIGNGAPNAFSGSINANYKL